MKDIKKNLIRINNKYDDNMTFLFKKDLNKIILSIMKTTSEFTSEFNL